MRFLVAASYGEKIIAVPHRLNKNEGAIKQQRDDSRKDKLSRVEIRAGGRRCKIGQDQGENGERGEHSQCGARAMDLESLLVMPGTAPEQAKPHDPVADD